MMLQVHSQTPSTRVQTIINAKGDTLIQMSLSDAKTLLKTVLDADVSDSLIGVYKIRDSINAKTITLQVSEIKLLQAESKNHDILEDNLNQMLNNKKTEITDLDNVISQQKKEIRKQKFLKYLGFTGAIVLPIVTLFLILK